MPALSPSAALALWAIPALTSAAALVLLVLWLRARRRPAVAHGARPGDARFGAGHDADLADLRRRLRIAGDLQQTAVRAVSGLVADAEGAGYAARSDPAAAGRALERIADRGRGALADMRRVLNAAGRDGDLAAHSASPRSARDLVSSMSTTGLEIEVVETGPRFALRRGAEDAVSRILEECLENARQHGGAGTRVRIGFSWSQRGLTVSVDDDGVRAAARRAGLSRDEVDRATAYTADEDMAALSEAGAGAGIDEMRMRAELFGGSLDARRVPGIGFSVTAAFPGLRHHNGIHDVALSR